MCLGVVVAFLLIMTGTAFWRLRFGEAALFLGLATGLTLLFFRKRLTALLALIISTIFALAGLRAISRPSAPGILLTFAAAIGGYLLIRWDARKHPDRAFGDWKSLFDESPE